MISIGEKIREARIARNLTQKELGNVLGLNEEVIINYENNKIKLEKEVNKSIKWVKDIQDIELVLMQDIMNKVHSSLTNALHSLDTSSRINWDDLLNEVVRETLSHNNIVGAIKITKNPDIKLDPGEANNIQLINDADAPLNKIIIENEYMRITLDPLEQINILLNSFKENYLSIIQE